MTTFFIMLIAVLCWLDTGSVQVAALQCPSCTYVTTDGDSSGIIKSVIDTFQDTKCSKDRISGPTPGIDEETCPSVSGKVARCSFYKGTMTLKVPLIGTEIPVYIYQRGCYHSSPANVPSNTCHRRQDINEDKTVLKQIVDRASGLFSSLDVVSFVGDLCLCSDTYCETSGGTQGAILYPLLFLGQLILVLFVL